MVIFMEIPSDPMHDILMKKPCNPLHTNEGENHDTQIQKKHYYRWHKRSHQSKFKAFYIVYVVRVANIFKEKSIIINIIYSII